MKLRKNVSMETCFFLLMHIKFPLHICLGRGNVGAEIDFRGQFKEVMIDFYGFLSEVVFVALLGVVCVLVVGNDICVCVARRKNTHTLRASKI